MILKTGSRKLLVAISVVFAGACSSASAMTAAEKEAREIPLFDCLALMSSFVLAVQNDPAYRDNIVAIDRIYSTIGKFDAALVATIHDNAGGAISGQNVRQYIVAKNGEALDRTGPITDEQRNEGIHACYGKQDELVAQAKELADAAFGYGSFVILSSEAEQAYRKIFKDL